MQKTNGVCNVVLFKTSTFVRGRIDTNLLTDIRNWTEIDALINHNYQESNRKASIFGPDARINSNCAMAN